MTTNLYSIHIKRLKSDFRFDISVEVIGHLQMTINDLEKYADDYLSKLPADEAEPLWDIARATAEHLHGAVLVTSQTYITDIISSIKRLHSYANAQAHALSSVSNDKYQMLASDSETISTTGVTKVLAIETLANYFKHRDEWDTNWTVNDRNRRTVSTLLALNLKPDTTDIISEGLKLLDGHLLSLPLTIPNIILEWQKSMSAKLQKELVASSLL